MADNRCFVDTNVLLAATDKTREHHKEALAFLDEGMAGRDFQPFTGVLLE